jgi:hypothetical protein
MISALYLTLAAAQLALWLWGARVRARQGARRGRSLALLLVLIPAALLWFDNLRIGLGRFIGAGEALYALSVPALVWHWTMLPFFVLAAWAIARDRQLRFAQARALWAIPLGIGAAMLVFEVPYAVRLLSGEMVLQLGCIGDAIRYTATLSTAYLCNATDTVARMGPGPVVAIVMNVFVLGVGVALWRARGERRLAITSAIMFVAAAAGPAFGAYAAPIANVGELVFVWGLLATAAGAGVSARTGAGAAGA